MAGELLRWGALTVCDAFNAPHERQGRRRDPLPEQLTGEGVKPTAEARGMTEARK
jgi:hypothetical protein